jgi:hypothetical protein
VAQPATSNRPVASQKRKFAWNGYYWKQPSLSVSGIFIAWWLLHGKNKPPRDTGRGE